jgi:hypothetical protein
MLATVAPARISPPKLYVSIRRIILAEIEVGILRRETVVGYPGERRNIVLDLFLQFLSLLDGLIACKGSGEYVNMRNRRRTHSPVL